MVNRKAYVNNYFTKTFPVWAAVIAIIGLISLLSGGEIFGLILIVIGGAVMAFKFFLKKTATDEEIDNLVAEELVNIQERGLEKIGLDESEVALISPIVIQTYYDRDLNSDTKAYFRRGDDGILRYSLIKGIVFYFSEKQLYCYTNVIDLATGNRYQETTDEYFYSDIVSVSTQSESYQYNVEKRNKITGRVKVTNKISSYDVESFYLTTSGGNTISANIKDGNAERVYGGTLNSESTENQIKAMRNLLRERKSLNS